MKRQMWAVKTTKEEKHHCENVGCVGYIDYQST
jgi:hypothetical protein